MTAITESSTVSLQYSLRTQDGALLEEVAAPDFQKLVMGQAQWPAAMEQVLLGKKAGEQATLDMAADDNVFGIYEELLQQTLPITHFAEDSPPVIGQLIEFKDDSDNTFEGQVLELTDSTALVDFNHPFSGRDIVLNLTIVAIES